MLSRILSIAVVALVCSTAQAQFSWGVRTGYQVSTLRVDRASSYTAKSSYVIPGFFIEPQLGAHSSLSIDLQYADKGFSKGVDVHIPYIAVPVLFHYRPIQAFSVFAGPELAFKLRTYSVFDGERVYDDEYFTSPFDLGASGGLSYQFSKDYGVMLRYTRGLVNVLDYPNNPSTFSNQAFQILLTSAFTYADSDKKVPVSFGLRQGISRYTLYGSGVAERDRPIEHRIGYEAGLDVRVEIKKYFFFSTGLSYLQKGGQIQGDKPVKIDYLSVPLTIGVSPIKTDPVTLSIEGGIGLNQAIATQNPYGEQSANSKVSNYTSTASYLYGFELSTNAIKRLTLFLSYRNILDNSRFTDRNYGYEFIHKGESLSIGARLRRGPRSKKAQEEEEEEEEEEVSLNRSGGRGAIGFKGGLNVNTMAYKNLPATVDGDYNQAKTGFHLGMFFKIKLSDRLALTPELQYTYKQAHSSSIENPIMLSYCAGPQLALEAGFQWGILLSNQVRSINSRYTESTSSFADLGWAAGLRYNVSKKVAFGCRYFRSVKSTTTWYDNGLPLATEGSSRNIQLSTYYRLGRS